ncbi:uncharacterized protein YdhG (YjbR/CyaY superfamily) [Saonia flava]|uniref:Uncharacterized protein YdhG (YjbR/CyaY superfamily) n=1 Tax=Saonia flava TaxID=523696 RepID=A0A846QWR4_9FLAO|nr:DUF1801 domain-containing protein [Saonia flava]NJB70035.1 uncharacterized protein YdhG (YjbR/CyaY superfamily) [Saonia flava]
MKGPIAQNVDDYIVQFPEETQILLKKIRSIIKKEAPEAKESINYGIPAYKLNGRPLVYFGGYKTHIGFYATPSGHAKFKKELSTFKQGKGSVQFPLKKDLPLSLISKMVAFRVRENGQVPTPKK